MAHKITHYPRKEKCPVWGAQEQGFTIKKKKKKSATVWGAQQEQRFTPEKNSAPVYGCIRASLGVTRRYVNLEMPMNPI